MPAFGSNSITCAFARRVLYEPVKGFRLSDRIVSAIDRFVGALTRFIVPGEPGVMNRWLFIYPFVGARDWTHALNLADAPGSGYRGGRSDGAGIYAPTGKFNRFAFAWTGGVTHNDLGVTFASDGSGNTNCDCADVYNCDNAWNRKSHGFYCRTNSAYAGYGMYASFYEPRNGYNYTQGIYPRYSDGTCYGDLCVLSKPGVFAGNRNQVAVGDSLGLFTDSQRGPYYGVAHYMYKRGGYISGDNSAENGMGYGDANSGAWMTMGTPRNFSFMFSTRHTRVLGGPLNTDGSGGGLPGDHGEWNFFVEQLQVALLREV